MDPDGTEDARGGEDALERRLREALEDRARLWEENQRLRAELREMEYFREIAGTVVTSTSWRVTKPLRASKKLVAWARSKSGRAAG